MNTHALASDARSAHSAQQRRLRVELVLASLWLALGFFALPAAIYAVGTALLGPYGENAGLGRFYSDFFTDLARPSGRAWVIALGPLLLISLLRLVLLRPAQAPAARGVTPPAHPTRSVADRRIEPRVSAE